MTAIIGHHGPEVAAPGGLAARVQHRGAGFVHDDAVRAAQMGTHVVDDRHQVETGAAVRTRLRRSGPSRRSTKGIACWRVRSPVRSGADAAAGGRDCAWAYGEYRNLSPAARPRPSASRGPEHALGQFGIFQRQVELVGRQLLGAFAEGLALRGARGISSSRRLASCTSASTASTCARPAFSRAFSWTRLAVSIRRSEPQDTPFDP